MNAEEIQAARALCEAATPVYAQPGHGKNSYGRDTFYVFHKYGEGAEVALVFTPADARFEVEARTLLPRALSALEACQRERETLRAALAITRGQWIHSVNAEQCLAALDAGAQEPGKAT